MTIPRLPVLGTPVAVTTYRGALDAAWNLSKRDRPAAVSACNTHLVALARHDPHFAEILWHFDLILPDGYPLVWEMNRQGARLTDRVYGPYFMQYALTHSPPGCRHYFFGGTPTTLEHLQAAARRMNPQIEIVGACSPPFGRWDENDKTRFADDIRRAQADFIWVALGGGRQERWIAKALRHHHRGVFIAVGDAFELLAGRRSSAPAWMQKRGLTWLYRLAQEPRRLGPRYLRYNSMFLYYCLRDRLMGVPRTALPHIAFLGSRGVPARYSGFETVVENLGAELAGRGYRVTVYNRWPGHSHREPHYRGMRILTLPTIPTKSLETIVHTALSAVSVLVRRYDLIYICGVGNTVIGGILKGLGFRVVLNVDGADFRRAKWGTLGRLWLRGSEAIAARCAQRVIADNSEIAHRYKRSYGATLDFISYGAVIHRKKIRTGELERWGLEPGAYLLYLSRLTPENGADLLLRAFARWRGSLRLVIVGSAHYEHSYLRKLHRLADDRVTFTGARFGDAYVELSQHGSLRWLRA